MPKGYGGQFHFLRQQRLPVQESALVNDLYRTFYSIEAARLGCLPIPPEVFSQLCQRVQDLLTD